MDAGTNVEIVSVGSASPDPGQKNNVRAFQNGVYFVLREETMTKLHELLAVQGNLSGQATKKRTDLKATFEKKRHLFEETRKTFTPNDELEKPQVEEQKDIQSSVHGEIDWIKPALAKALDVAYQVDLANTEAKADVVTEDNEILLKAVPATTLLQLEKRVAEWKDLIQSIPTLDPAKGFKADAARGRGYYQARDVTKPRTKKEPQVITLAPATKEHPAQTQLISTDKPIGTILEQEWSSLITPATKADLLDRVETLLRAVTKARSKANDHSIDVSDKKIGADLLEFVFKPLDLAV